MAMVKNNIVFLNIFIFLFLLNYLPVDESTAKGLSLLVFIAVLWLTEALHVTITALLVPVLAVFLDILPVDKALSSFAHPIIFLFLGGFALAAALSKQGLDKAMANVVLRRAGGHLGRALIMLFILSAGLSMWISNTATVAMMLPLMLGLLSQLRGEKEHGTWVFALLGLAYSSSIGGIATLVGSPPNAIAAAETNIAFLDWTIRALPLTLLLLPSAILLLYFLLKPRLGQAIAVTEEKIEWNEKKKVTLLIFGATVFFWMFSKPINTMLGGIVSFDSLVAVMAIIALAVGRAVEWQDVEEGADWGVLFLFGGGLCLSQVLQVTGASLFLGETIGGFLQSTHAVVAIVVVVTFVVFLTELASNTASAALLVPVFVALSPSVGVDPVVMASLIAVAASCAFMLPVATPPNAIVFGTGLVPQKTMMKTGLYLNLICILMASTYAFLFW
ncbi:MAG TPA: DASS family sodium-coupled anion symporter [Alcanivoracaceae bacterium]|nr:DASS family sodium-coupled anion symporter [Alcanivoracaceae bacterium]